MHSSLITSSQPRSVVAGDFNNDDYIDIIVANSGTHTIGIFLSKGDGTFTHQHTYSTGSQSRPYSIVVGDFNNDNNLDIAVANYGTNNIGIFLGNGNGSCTAQNVFSLDSSRPLFITVADFNQDNQTDIVVANYGTNSVGILLGYGNGSFQDPTTYSTGDDSIPSSLVVGDFNKDNELDIGVANYGTNNIGILLGYGNGLFASQVIYTIASNSQPSSIALGDINNDTNLDLIVANYGTGNVGILFGYGNGTFAPQTTFSISTNSRPQYIGLGDFDQDNQLDVVVVDSDNDQIHILLQYDHKTFTLTTTYDAISESRPSFAAVADFNNDNQLDIVVTNYGTNSILILSGYSMKPSTRQKNYFIGENSRPSSAVIYDFNDDGRLDLVVNNFGNDTVHILTGNGDGTFAPERTYSTGNKSAPKSLCIGDVNNDNRMDIISANFGSDSIGVLLAHDNGTFADVTTYFVDTGSQPRSVAVGDFNNDSRLDIVTANYGSGGISILFGYGNGTFSNATTYFTNLIGPLITIAVGDVNKDNKLDIVTAAIDIMKVIILLGYGNGSFSNPLAYFLGRNVLPSSVAVSDFDCDNRLDIVVTNIQGSYVGVLLGNGNGTFKPITRYSTWSTSSLYAVSIADLNNDNRYDLVVANIADDEIIIFYGYGNGSFQLARTYSTGFGSAPNSVTTAKLNNNNKTNIVTTFRGTGNVAILTEYNSANFANQITYSTGSAARPYSVTVGDFNNDSQVDIAVINSGTDNLGILLGLGNNMFQAQMLYPIGVDARPQYVTTGDINNDNYLDIITANSKNDSISVFMGQGNGTFAAQKMYSTGYNSRPMAVIIDDLNNDNRLDFVVANAGTNNIGILLGFVYRSFHSPKTYSKKDALGPWCNVVGDFNNDNYLDIAVGFLKSDEIGILLGNGDGSFRDFMFYSTGTKSQPSSLSIYDFNNDGRMDIIVCNHGIRNIAILLGYGNGSFATMGTYSTGARSSPQATEIADMNKDGQMDIVVVNSITNNVGILFGRGDGSFSTLVSYSTGIGSGPTSLAVGDFNNDSRLDIVVSNYDGSNVGIFIESSNGGFENQVTYSTGYLSLPFWVAVEDFDEDGRLDIAVSNYNNNNVGIFLGYGNGSFAPIVKYSTGIGSAPKQVRVADFNNDNILDIAVANYGTNNIVVLFGFGDGTFLLGTAYPTGVGSAPNALAIGYFNNDTRLDIVVGNFLSNTIQIFLGYDPEPFAGVVIYSTGDKSEPHLIAVNDLNSDNWLDIIVANYGTDNVGILFGRGNGLFDTIRTYSTGIGSAPYSVAVSDFNSDNYLDIVVTNSKADNIAILFGYSNRTFVIGQTYSTGTRSRPYAVALGDFNNDTIVDIAVANSGTSNIFLLHGYGNGTFGNENAYILGYGYEPYSIAITDLNGDGWMEIAIACYGTDNVETLIKMC
jgi:hypothetical protein